MTGDLSSTSRRGILCADLDAMFAAIEVRERHLSADSLVVVGGDPDARGVVSTCSYSARAFGVHSAMPAGLARRLCPQALFLPPRHELYSSYSRRVMSSLGQFGPLEQVSIDEAFVDIGPAGLTADLGRAVKLAVRKETGLTCSVGLAVNKLVAKIASGVGKPDGLILVSPGDEAGFLAPLPVEKLWGVGPRTAERLGEMGVALVRDLRELSLATLQASFGTHHGLVLHRHARGEDDGEVVTSHDPRQLSQEETFAQDVLDRGRLWQAIRSQADELADRLRRRGLVAHTVSLKLRYSDFTTITRSSSRDEAIESAEEIAALVGSLVRTHWERGRPVRLIGVACTRLEQVGEWRQLHLPSLALPGAATPSMLSNSAGS